MGRPKKKLSELAPGSYRPSRHGPLTVAEPDEYQPPVKPKLLGKRESKVWDELVPTLGVTLRPRDTFLLVQFCRWWVYTEDAHIRADNADPGTRDRQVATVEAGIGTDKLLKMIDVLGMSPAARVKLKQMESASTGPPKAKVETRQPTRIDRLGKPK